MLRLSGSRMIADPSPRSTVPEISRTHFPHADAWQLGRPAQTASQAFRELKEYGAACYYVITQLQPRFDFVALAELRPQHDSASRVVSIWRSPDGNIHIRKVLVVPEHCARGYDNAVARRIASDRHVHVHVPFQQIVPVSHQHTNRRGSGRGVNKRTDIIDRSLERCRADVTRDCDSLSIVHGSK